MSHKNIVALLANKDTEYLLDCIFFVRGVKQKIFCDIFNSGDVNVKVNVVCDSNEVFGYRIDHRDCARKEFGLVFICKRLIIVPVCTIMSSKVQDIKFRPEMSHKALVFLDGFCFSPTFPS